MKVDGESSGEVRRREVCKKRKEQKNEKERTGMKKGKDWKIGRKVKE